MNLENINKSYYENVYVNPNTGGMTSSIKNTSVNNKEVYSPHYMECISSVITEDQWYKDQLAAFSPLKDKGETTISKINNSITFGVGASTSLSKGFTIKLNSMAFQWEGDVSNNRAGYEEAVEIGGALTKLIRIANGQGYTINNNSTEQMREWTSNVLKGLEAFGIDTSKNFTVNGTKFHINDDGVLETQDSIDAQKAYEMQVANNRTYEFADDKTKNIIDHLTSYYTANVPGEISAAWQQTLEETGINPFSSGYSSALSQLSQEKDFASGGDVDIFGSTLESSIEAVQKILERINNPLAFQDAELSTNEKQFYTSLLDKLQQL